MASKQTNAAGRMSWKLDTHNNPERLNDVATVALVQRLNEWRAANGFIGKSEAARILIERALDEEDR